MSHHDCCSHPLRAVTHKSQKKRPKKNAIIPTKQLARILKNYIIWLYICCTTFMCHPGLIYPSNNPCKTSTIVESLNVLEAAVLKSRVGGSYSGQWSTRLEDINVYLQDEGPGPQGFLFGTPPSSAHLVLTLLTILNCAGKTRDNQASRCPRTPVAWRMASLSCPAGLVPANHGCPGWVVPQASSLSTLGIGAPAWKHCRKNLKVAGCLSGCFAVCGLGARTINKNASNQSFLNGIGWKFEKKTATLTIRFSYRCMSILMVPSRLRRKAMSTCRTIRNSKAFLRLWMLARPYRPRTQRPTA